MSQEHAWTYYYIIFGGALVFDFFNVGIVVFFLGLGIDEGENYVEEGASYASSG